MAENDFDFGDRAEPLTGKALPSVYMFQPAYSVVVNNDELEEWQRALEEKVGLKRADIEGMRPIGTYCICGSTYFSEACDCD